MRISQDRADERVGVTRQRADGEALVARRWPDEQVVLFEDDDRSAYRGKRPAFERLLAGVRDGSITGVVGYNIDRMFRQPRELEAFIDLCTERRLTRVATAEGDLDLTTHDGQLQARILVAVARKSSDDTSRRVKRAARDRADAGLFHGGPVPYGFRLAAPGVLVHDEVAVADIRAMAGRMLAGVSVHRAVLERPAGSAGPRSREGWRLLLLSMPVRGRNGAGQPAGWAPVLDPFTATRLTELLSVQRSRARANRVWPLSTVARCGVCDGPLYGSLGARSHGKRAWENYGCRTVGCHKVAISAGQLHAFVLAALDARVITARVEQRVQRDVRVEQALDHLAAEYAAGRISRREWESARAAVAQPAVRGTGSRVVAVSGTDDGFQPRLSIAVEKIVVGRGARRGPVADLDRVTIHWRNSITAPTTE